MLINNHNFKKGEKLAQRPIFLQVLLSPYLSFIFFVLSRTAKLLGRSIPGKAKTFWGEEISGSFPNPVFSSIFLYGFLEESVTYALLKYLKPGMTFIDIGASEGYFSLLASKMVGKSGFVVGFEPTPATFLILCKNLANAGNCLPVSMAAWSKNGYQKLLDYGYFYFTANSFFPARLSEKTLETIKPSEILVQTVVLDDYFALMKIRPSFIKIDAESAEYEILKGLRHTLETVKPILMVEIGDKLEYKGRSELLIDFLRKMGYKPYEYLDGQFKSHVKKESYLNLYDNLLFLSK